jgi:hypothetical protein
LAARRLDFSSFTRAFKPVVLAARRGIAAAGFLHDFVTFDYEIFNQMQLLYALKEVDFAVKNPSCPNCAKAIQHRHTYMTSFPLTLVCAGCGSWLKLDVKRTGNMVVLALCVATLGLAYFSPYFLVLMPLYLVLAVGPLVNFSVEMVKKRRAELWTINRRSGSLRPVNAAEQEAQRDVQLSSKLAGMQPFEVLPGGLGLASEMPKDLSKAAAKAENWRSRRPKRPGDMPVCASVVQAAKNTRPKYSFEELPTGLPH